MICVYLIVADTPVGGATGPAGGGAGGANSASRRFLTEFLQEPPAVADAPQFDLSVPSNLTGLVGQPVRLLCRVRALGNRTVSIIYICKRNKYWSVTIIQKQCYHLMSIYTTYSF